MKTTKIFRWIWRINGLLFLICGLTIVITISVALFPTVRGYFTRKPIYHADNMVNVKENKLIDSEWTLGGFRQIGKSGFTMASVHAKQEYNIGLGSGKEASSDRNYLFLNTTDKSTRWLVPTNQYLFLSANDIKEGESPDSKVIGIQYRIVKDDTDRYGRLTQNDEVTFGLSDIDGSNFTEVIGGIDVFLSNEQPAEDSLLLIYRSDGRNLLSEIKISEKKVIQTKELSKINE